MGFLRRALGGSEPAHQEVNAWLVEPTRKDATLEVVGESNYQDQLIASGGGRTPDGVAVPDQRALLVPEPQNPYDKNAISVRIEGGGLVGYLSRADAEAYGPVVQWALRRDHYLAARARLIGGWDNGSGNSGSVGIVLHVGSPAETFIELAIEDGDVRTDHRWAGQRIAFTGDPTARIQGERLDRGAAEAIARKAGMSVHPRVTKQVQLLVDCDPSTVSGNQAKAIDYGIPVISESDFWAELGVPVERVTW